MEKISALIDGELDERGAQQQFARLKQDGELLRCWATFHLIGDAMRGDRALSPEFEARLAERLAAEPTVLAPQRRTVKRAVTYALSAAASLSAVALVGWMAFFNNPLAPQAEIASISGTAPAVPIPAAASATTASAVVPQAQLASVPSDGTMNEYLIAHQAFSPSTEIQGVAPYIRGVSSVLQEKDR